VSVRPSQRGFTLIEIMIVVGIIGILASIAMPLLSHLQLRSKSAERQVIMQAIYRSIDDLWTRDAKFPIDLGASGSLLNLPDQPDTTPTTTKAPWRLTATDPTDHWNKLSLIVEGAVYYRYGGTATMSGGIRTYNLYAYGDLDGDGNQNRWNKMWQWVNDQKQVVSGSTLDCADCTFAEEIADGLW
jgi:prepilin-type N-terminal cleavage/methylation domain-containing protein